MKYSDDYGIVTVEPRISFSRARKVRIYDARKGVCGKCGCRIELGQKWHIGHDKALGLTGSNDDANLWPEHEECNMADAYKVTTPAVRKATRVRAKHLGIKKKKRGFFGWRKMNGEKVFAKDRT